MSLRTKIQELRTAADVADDENQVRTRTGQLLEFTERLQAPAEALPALVVGLAELRKLCISLPAEVAQNAGQAVDGLRALADELPAMAVDASLDLAKVRVRAAEEFSGEMRTFVSGAWQHHLDKPTPAINEELVDALAHSGVDVEAIRGALVSAQARIFAVKNRAIPDEGDVEKFAAALEALRTCGEQIIEVVDPDIAAGILGAQEEGGMPLEWFTRARLEGLTSLGIINRFQVHLK